MLAMSPSLIKINSLQHWSWIAVIIIIILNCCIMLSSIMSWFIFKIYCSYLIYEMQADMQSANYYVVLSIELNLIKYSQKLIAFTLDLNREGDTNNI